MGSSNSELLRFWFIRRTGGINCTIVEVSEFTISELDPATIAILQLVKAFIQAGGSIDSPL